MLRRSILISGISGLAAFSGLALAQSMSSTSAEKALPYSKRPEVKKFIQDKDLIAQAHTGSGKTLAFLLPLFTHK